MTTVDDPNYIPRHNDALTDMLIKQKWLQSRMPPLRQPPGELTGDDRADYIRTMVLAATDELHEAMNEVGWKPWATSRHVNRDAYVSELIDVLLFWFNLCLVANVSADEIHAGYIKAFEKSISRQAEGYDGVVGKCPRCHRDYDDAGVECDTGSTTAVTFDRSEPFVIGSPWYWCAGVKRYVNESGEVIQ
jgi:dUTPase